MKQQEEVNKKLKQQNQKTKSQENEERVNKSRAKKALKQLQKKCVFQTSPVCFSNKTIFCTEKKHQCVQKGSLFSPPRSKNWFVALQQKPNSCRKIVVSEFWGFCLRCERAVCTIFAQLVLPKKLARNGHFSKKTPCRRIVVWGL